MVARRIAAAAVIAAAVALSACGGGGGDAASASASGAQPPGAEPLGEKLGGSVAQLANCGDWDGGPRDRKLATIADIRNQVNRTDTGIDSPPLSDEEALSLFDSECAKPYAKGFRLYVIYARAAGFAPLVRE